MKMYDDQLIVITGAAGFIGSCCVKYLNEKGFNNLLLVDDIKKTEKWKNLVNKKCVDFISRNELFQWLQGKERDIEAFIHLGACSDTMETDGNYLMENNFRYSVRLAEYALAHGHRFIYASSAATYGDGTKGFIDNHAEIESLKPLNLYGFSKYYFDLWLKQQGLLDQVVGLKYFNVYGPNENHKGRMASMVYKMLPIAQKEGVIKLFKSSEPDRFGDGEQCRDFIYVKDAVRMTCDFLENDLTGIFNIGSGKTTTWNDLANALFKALDKPSRIEYVDMPEALLGQYQNYTCADMSKYKEKTGLPNAQPSCEFSTEQGVADYVRNYLLKDERW
ncbi:MAG: ADP-glyceromanno-heptose 6-epimerase [Parachlamydiales bacterium]|nr:ADP-glyceromanno-heptose 6-epimerase [Verrucomicrobiota bacterium]MBX3718849.1 ADP-glyceromanno-heptose 6-epimerase [Candidatus Acheromyda pituitae]